MIYSLHKKPSIRARISSNTDRRTPGITGCSDVFDYGWLEIHLEFFIRIRPLFPYSTWILANDSKCSISHTGHVLIDLCCIRFFSKKQRSSITRNIWTLSAVREFATGTHDARRPFCRERLGILMVMSSMLSFSRIARYEYESSATFFTAKDVLCRQEQIFYR